LVSTPMVPEFIPVRVMTSTALAMPRASGKSALVNDGSTDLISQRRAPRSGTNRPDANRIEIVLPDGTCVRVDDGVGVAALRRVMTAVRR
jgi:transposase